MYNYIHVVHYFTVKIVYYICAALYDITCVSLEKYALSVCRSFRKLYNNERFSVDGRKSFCDFIILTAVQGLVFK